MVDKTWAEYERELSDAIASLVAGGVDAATWVRVLVPFVACMLVRGPDFGGRFGRRMAALGLDDIDGGYTPADNANLARLMELQRLLGPVAVAKWVVVRFPGQGSLLPSDLGYTPFRNRARGEAGIAVPLGPSHALTVTPRREGRVAVVRSGRWVPEVEHVAAAPGDREGLNRAVSAAAQRFLFGPDEEFVGEWLRAAPARARAARVHYRHTCRRARVHLAPPRTGPRAEPCGRRPVGFPAGCGGTHAWLGSQTVPSR